MSNIIPFNEMNLMASAVAKSGLFGFKSIEQALTLMMIAQSDNIHPARAALEYDIIGGKPALKATSILARFQDSGGIIEWLETNDKKAVAKFTHPKGGTITIEWTIERAKTAGVYDSNPTWKKYPDQMLRARCIPEGVRAIYPSCLSGLYSTDEVQAFTTTSEPKKFEDDGEFLEAEIEVPKTTIKAEKAILSMKLKELNLSAKEIKGFAEFYNLGDDLEAVVELNSNEELLITKIKEYEGTLDAN